MYSLVSWYGPSVTAGSPAWSRRTSLAWDSLSWRGRPREELILYDHLTGSEYLGLVAGLKGADEAQIPIELEFFGIAHAAKKLVGGYSLGMRKKLGLAAAMLGEPGVFVLYEPLNGLDVEMMRKLRLRMED